MKKKVVNQKLVLKKRTVVNLEQPDMAKIKGGYDYCTLHHCATDPGRCTNPMSSCIPTLKI